MIATFDKVILLKDDKDNLKGIVIHDPKSHHQVHYTVSEMGADELAALYEAKEAKEVKNETIRTT